MDLTVLHTAYLVLHSLHIFLFFFFFNDTATTEIYTLSLHDALPICGVPLPPGRARDTVAKPIGREHAERQRHEADERELRTHDPGNDTEADESGERQHDRREL